MAQRIIHIALAAFVLLSTTGLTLGKHICKKQLQAKGVELAVKKCGADGQPCDKDCCSSEYKYFDSGQEKLTQTVELPALNKPVLLNTLLLAFQINLPSFENQSRQYLTYRPPIVYHDIPVLFQSFLI